MTAPDDFTLHFELNTSPREREPRTPEELDALEIAFAREQIATLLRFVTLYAEGRALSPDAFSIVNAPARVHPLHPDDTDV